MPPKVRVCIASFEFIGPFRNGGIGTANTSLGEALARAGHEVTFLYVRPQWDYDYGRSGDIKHWTAHYAAKGIEFVPLPPYSEDSGDAQWSPAWHIGKSTDICQWLSLQPRFDAVHFSDHLGFGYVPLLAKKQDGAFKETVLCMGVHGSHQWLRELHAWVKENVFLEHIERESVAMADVLWSPSAYMMDWMSAHHWELPARRFVRPYILPYASRTGRAEAAAHEPSSSELVFFGRLESRKGLVLFCDALDQLQRDYEGPLRITFLGRHAEVEGRRSRDYISERARSWPWPWQVLSDLDQPEALGYLRCGAKLAVIASPVDNSPNTIYECLGAGVPFIACRCGGVPELIHSEDLDGVCFRYDVDALAAMLMRNLRSGVRTARPAVDFEKNDREWVAWHEALPGMPPAASIP
jgi:O-antigen biosynthesis protein